MCPSAALEDDVKRGNPISPSPTTGISPISVITETHSPAAEGNRELRVERPREALEAARDYRALGEGEAWGEAERGGSLRPRRDEDVVLGGKHTPSSGGCTAAPVNVPLSARWTSLMRSSTEKTWLNPAVAGSLHPRPCGWCRTTPQPAAGVEQFLLGEAEDVGSACRPRHGKTSGREALAGQHAVDVPELLQAVAAPRR